MGIYRVEISANARAGCQNKECKDQGIKIQKGELRFGTFVTIMEHQTWRWKHWGCVTPAQIVNLEESLENDVNNLDGYDELDEDAQAKISKAMEEGHVADEDWRGDVEVNRKGMKGFRSSATKQKAKEEKKALEAAANGDTTPSKPPSKKRGRPKTSPDAEEDEEEPTPKKAKAPSIRKTKAQKDQEPESSAPPKTSSAATKKKAKAIKNEDDVANPPSQDEIKPTTKKAKKVKSEENGAGSTGQETSNKRRPKAKGESNASVQVKVEENEEEEETVQNPPAKRTRASKNASQKKVKSEDYVEDERHSDLESDHQKSKGKPSDANDGEPATSGKRGRGKSATKSGKGKKGKL